MAKPQHLQFKIRGLGRPNIWEDRGTLTTINQTPIAVVRSFKSWLGRRFYRHPSRRLEVITRDSMYSSRSWVVVQEYGAVTRLLHKACALSPLFHNR
jgi:hypothetical protein